MEGTKLYSGSPKWMKPNDIMKMRKFKAKKKALQARMNATLPLHILLPQSEDKTSHGIKRQNPFRSSPKKCREDVSDLNTFDTCDGTLFQLMNGCTSLPTKEKFSQSFSSIFSSSNIVTPDNPDDKHLESVFLVVDWSLKSKIRFLSSKQLPWKQSFKTSEEASGITGFVRCLNSSSKENEEITLDTSSSAQFYQCCLVWTHPSISWLQLFPRYQEAMKASLQVGIFGSDQMLADSLHAEWSESLRSLHQLLRVRQCPYFYVCGHSFTCLFRAAGVAGIPNAHALIVPTTKGFRESMKNEGIEFKMPLLPQEVENSNKLNVEEIENEDHDDAAWLEDLGVETSQFPNLNSSKSKASNKEVSDAQTLVYVEDMEILGLINFLLNCRSCVSTIGPLACVPPTLVSPVAFQGATLKPLKIKSSTVERDSGTQHCMEITGPIMPHTFYYLTDLLTNYVDDFDIKLVPLSSTISFSKFLKSGDTYIPKAFAQEGLVDCGLCPTFRDAICAPLEESMVSTLPYREVAYKAGKYLWPDV